MFTQLKNIIPQTALKKGIFQEISSSQMCYEIQKIINSFWQDNRGRPPKVASFKKNKIVIKCGSSSCMQELEMLKLEILNKIQEKNFDKKVTDLRFALD